MDDERRYTVVIEYVGGLRDVRASNVTLESAQAVQASLAPVYPNARVLIEPIALPDSEKAKLSDTHRPGLGDTWQGP